MTADALSGLRLQLGDSFRRKLFDSILKENNLTLHDLSTRLGCGYSGLKRWRRGEDLLPETFFNALLELSNSKIKSEARKSIIKRIPDGWGRGLGGKNTANKYTKFLKQRMKRVRSFKDGLYVPDFETAEMDDEIWELVGAALGDGCLSSYYATYGKQKIFELILTGNMHDDLEYYKRRLVPLLQSKFKSKTNYHFRPENNVIYLRLKSRGLFNLFNKLGVPVGKKKNKLRITEQIFHSNVSAKAAILRGLLDTDGHIFARKDEGYKYPYLKITSGSSRFLQDLKKLIREFGPPAYIHGTDVLIRGGGNLSLWMKKIGSSHPMNINRYNTWLSTGRLLPKRALGSARYERPVRNGEVAGSNPAGSTHSSKPI